MTTTRVTLTIQEYLDPPEAMLRYEIVDGELRMSATSNIHHQRASSRTFISLGRFVTDHGLGKVLCAPVDVIIQQEPPQVRQPNLLFVSNEQGRDSA